VANPAKILEESKIRKEEAKAKTKRLPIEIISEITNTGFLPILSDTLPSTGEKRNCIKAKEAIRIPRAADPTFSDSA